MQNFDFLEKDLGIVFPPHFEYDFSRKMFLMFFSILTNLQHECETRATRVRQKQHKCDTSETRATQVQHK